MSEINPIQNFLQNNNEQNFIDAVKKVILGTHKPPINIDHLAPLAMALDSSLYAAQHMFGKPRFQDRHELIPFVTTQLSFTGLILEFGVNTGSTINHIADKIPNQTIYGFDSFEGLPEDWTPYQKKGTFKRDSLPHVRQNVELIVGWFNETLPGFADTHPGPASLIHVDCDLYSSTKTILDVLNKRIVPGTIILFDEYFNYNEWRQHEYKAFQEFCAENKVKYEYIGLTPLYEQVAVRILDRQ